MARGMNKVMLIGNLGKGSPKLKYAASGTEIANFSIATNENRKNADGEWEEHAEWHNIVAFGKLATVCDEYLSTGSKVYIEGRIQTRSWEGDDGKKRYMTEIIANQMIMLDSAGGGNAKSDAPVSTEDDDLPF